MRIGKKNIQNYLFDGEVALKTVGVTCSEGDYEEQEPQGYNSGRFCIIKYILCYLGNNKGNT